MISGSGIDSSYAGFAQQREEQARARYAGRVTVEVHMGGETSYSYGASDPMRALGRAPDADALARMIGRYAEEARAAREAGREPPAIDTMLDGDSLRRLVTSGAVSHRDAQLYARGLYAQREREATPGNPAGNHDLVDFVRWSNAEAARARVDHSLMGYSPRPAGRGPTLGG